MTGFIFMKHMVVFGQTELTAVMGDWICVKKENVVWVFMNFLTFVRHFCRAQEKIK